MQTLETNREDVTQNAQSSSHLMFLLKCQEEALILPKHNLNRKNHPECICNTVLIVSTINFIISYGEWNEKNPTYGSQIITSIIYKKCFFPKFLSPIFRVHHVVVVVVVSPSLLQLSGDPRTEETDNLPQADLSVRHILLLSFFFLVILSVNFQIA